MILAWKKFVLNLTGIEFADNSMCKTIKMSQGAQEQLECV